MKQVDPVIWAVWGGIFGAALGAAAAISGHPMPQTAIEAGMGGFFWGWVVALIRNKLAH